MGGLYPMRRGRAALAVPTGFPGGAGVLGASRCGEAPVTGPMRRGRLIWACSLEQPGLWPGRRHATESGHVRFGGGPSKKDQVNWYLVGGLPYVTLSSLGAWGV